VTEGIIEIGGKPRGSAKLIISTADQVTYLRKYPAMK